MSSFKDRKAWIKKAVFYRSMRRLNRDIVKNLMEVQIVALD